MKVRVTRALFAASMLALTACSATPVGVPGPPAPNAASRNISKGDLLYVSDAGTDVVYVYTYPDGSLVGKLTGVGIPLGLCADASGDVFVTSVTTSGASNVLEFAHGGTKPIHTFDDSGMKASGCAVDPASGDLAIANVCTESRGSCTGHGNIVVYTKASGSPKRYSTPYVGVFYYCGYDGSGNLFADGSSTRIHFKLAELPKGGGRLTLFRIDWDRSGYGIQYPGGVQWDGQHLAVGNVSDKYIYKPTIFLIALAHHGYLKRLVLNRARSVDQFWIDGTTLIAPASSLPKAGKVFFYRYPRGGRPFLTITGLDFPVGAVVSHGSDR